MLEPCLLQLCFHVAGKTLTVRSNEKSLDDNATALPHAAKNLGRVYYNVCVYIYIYGYMDILN